MQYKNATKLIIDKRKLDILLRLGCPDKQILELIKTGEFTKTGDSLVDETLECLLDVKCFRNWGGNRENSGRKSNNFNKLNQVENQVDFQDEKQDENHLANQDIFQVVDKDKDKDIYNINNNNNNLNNIYIQQFEEFWKTYTPVKCDGRFIDKGSKKTAQEKFVKILKKGEKYENIINGCREYIEHCKRNNQLTCGVAVFLNQERWKNDYSGETCESANSNERPKPRSIVETYAEIAAELAKKDNIW